MNDSMDLDQEIPETPWLGAALVAAGALCVASAAVMLVLVFDGVASAIRSPLAGVLGGLLSAALVRLGAYGVKTCRRGVSMVAPWTWRVLLDARDRLLMLAARFLGDESYRRAGLDHLPRPFATVTLHDLGQLGPRSLVVVLRLVDVRDLALLLRVHKEFFGLLDTLVTNGMFSPESLQCLRNDMSAVDARWADYRDTRDQVTHIIRQLVHLNELPELVTAKPH